jgi:hypothetical protein
MKIKGQAQGVVVPGPNMAYFDQEVSLSKMVHIIYGSSVLNGVSNMFVKELTMYIDYLKMKLKEFLKRLRAKLKKWNSFKTI